MKLRVLLQAARGPFLLLTPVCVLLGAAVTQAAGVTVDVALLLQCLLGALCAHVAVNTLNEYQDFRSGLDLATERTPFSGGSGALPANPEAAPAVRTLGLLSLTLVAVIGIRLLWQTGPALLLVGLPGILLVVLYTGWINRHPLLCLLAPGLGFGLLMVLGTQLVLQGHVDPTGVLAALVPFCLVNNLLLLNQYPDIHADRAAGRRHVAIAHGVAAASRAYALLALLAVMVIVFAVIAGRFPPLALLALLPMPLALFAWRGALSYGEALGRQPRYLAANVAVTLLVPLLLGLALLPGSG